MNGDVVIEFDVGKDVLLVGVGDGVGVGDVGYVDVVVGGDFVEYYVFDFE